MAGFRIMSLAEPDADADADGGLHPESVEDARAKRMTSARPRPRR